MNVEVSEAGRLMTKMQAAESVVANRMRAGAGLGLECGLWSRVVVNDSTAWLLDMLVDQSGKLIIPTLGRID